MEKREDESPDGANPTAGRPHPSVAANVRRLYPGAPGIMAL